MKSPIAPPRITRMRFMLYCPRCRRSQTAATGLISRKRETENDRAITKRDRVQGAPAESGTRTPINLVAEQVRHCDPEQAGDDKQISEHGHEQTARFITQKRRVEQRLSGKQTKNSKRAHRKKFLDEPQDKHVTDRQCDEEWSSKSLEFSHLDCRKQPKRPDKRDGQQNNSRSSRARKVLRDAGEVRFEQTGQTDQNQEQTRKDSHGLQGKMVNHVRHGESVLWRT